MPAETLASHLAILGGEGVLPEILASAYPQALSVRIGEGGERIGRIGDIIAGLKQAEIQQICMIGRLQRPSFMSLMPSSETARLLMKYGFSFKGGDDSLLRRLRQMLEAEGFDIIGAHRLCPDLLAPKGILTDTPVEDEDYAAYMALVREFGLQDKGQSIVISQGVQIDEEDGSGTNSLMSRNAGREAILVKAAKPQQDLDMDMPTIGRHTIENAIAYGFKGIIVEAGRTLFPEQSECLALANAQNLFIMGL